MNNTEMGNCYRCGNSIPCPCFDIDIDSSSPIVPVQDVSISMDNEILGALRSILEELKAIKEHLKPTAPSNFDIEISGKSPKDFSEAEYDQIANVIWIAKKLGYSAQEFKELVDKQSR
jgi:hypothetical protein